MLVKNETINPFGKNKAGSLPSAEGGRLSELDATVNKPEPDCIHVQQCRRFRPTSATSEAGSTSRRDNR